ncbi:MAG: division/cell wall cluster transcriptional repressor MraZ [Candidatus Taylorbacteria bacterium]|nr:division/cell wall cluster transcriptional repressor MraZ [Candidatus Taylorbacteria bacterium]
MIIGTYFHTIDDKNRLSLPSKFRKEMGRSVVVTPGLDSCLFVFTATEWERISERLSGKEASMFKADNRSLNRYLLGMAVEVEVDGAGRMLIPEHLRERAKLKSKVVFIGVRDRVEIWDESIWQEYAKTVEGKADSLAEKYGEVGMI